MPEASDFDYGSDICTNIFLCDARSRSDTVAKLIFRHWSKIPSRVVAQFNILAGGTVAGPISRCMKSSEAHRGKWFLSLAMLAFGENIDPLNFRVLQQYRRNSGHQSHAGRCSRRAITGSQKISIRAYSCIWPASVQACQFHRMYDFAMLVHDFPFRCDNALIALA